MILCLQRTAATEELSYRGQEWEDYTPFAWIHPYFCFSGCFFLILSFWYVFYLPINSDPLLVWASFWGISFAPVSLVINPGVKVSNLTAPSLLSFAIQMYYINFKHRISPNKDHHFHPQTCIFLSPSWNLVWKLLLSHCSITSPLGPRPTQSFSHISNTSKISVPVYISTMLTSTACFRLSLSFTLITTVAFSWLPCLWYGPSAVSLLHWF